MSLPISGDCEETDLNTPPSSNLDANASSDICHTDDEESTLSSQKLSVTEKEVNVNFNLKECTKGLGTIDKIDKNESKESKVKVEHIKNSDTNNQDQCRCLICFSVCDGISSGAIKNKEASFESTLGTRLHVIFILRNLLEVPRSTTVKYLVNLGEEYEKWVSLCSNCSKIIDLAKEVYEELLKITRKFKSLKKIILDKVKDSAGCEEDGSDSVRRPGRKRKCEDVNVSKVNAGNVTQIALTNESRQFVKQHVYGHLIDPFQDGDLMATKLLAGRPHKTSIPPSINDLKPFPVNNNAGRGELTFLYLPREEQESDNCDDGGAADDGDEQYFDLSSDDVELLDDEDNDPTFSDKSYKSKRKKHFATPASISRTTKSRRQPRSSTNSECDDSSTSTFVEYPIGNPSVQKIPKNKGRTPTEVNVKFTCPYCEAYYFKMSKGELFCEHLEGCEGLKGEKKEKLLCCPVCRNFKKSLKEKTRFVEHLSLCYKNPTDAHKVPLNMRIFECDKCPGPVKKYFKVDGFVQHYAHHKKYFLHCAICPAKFFARKLGHIHFRTRHPELLSTYTRDARVVEETILPLVPWWCPICPDAIFIGEATRDSHILSEHPNYLKEAVNQVTCQFCPKPFTCSYERELHEGTEHVGQKSLFHCSLCSEIFAKETQLKAHRISKHRLDLLVCHVCGLECVSKATLKNHLQTHQQVRRYPCTQPGCDVSCTTLYFLKGHMNKVHGDREDPQKNPQLCGICKKVFHKRIYLLKHIKEHHEGKYEITCELCGQGIQSNSHLKRHMSQTHGIGEYGKHKCTYEGCNRVFWDRNRYRLHLTQHSGSPQFKCNFCQKEFYFASLLKRHELIHTNAESKPFQCEICAKRFPVRNYLYIHMKSHRKEETEHKY